METDTREARECLKQLGVEVSDIVERDYGQTEFFLADDDGHSHCFDIATIGKTLGFDL